MYFEMNTYPTVCIVHIEFNLASNCGRSPSLEVGSGHRFDIRSGRDLDIEIGSG
jgi:hypothetical protein